MKKTLSLLLALVMLLSMIPLTAFAAEEYVISDKTLSEGSNTVSLDPSSTYTLFEFTADSAATYTFTAASGVQLADYGTSFYQQNITVGNGNTMTNTLDLTFTAAGTSKLVGVYNPSGSSKSVTIKVTQGAAYVDEVIPLYTYENKAKLSQFTLPSDAVLGSYIDVYSSTNHKAVLGSDGYYHLDSASGDILLVDLDYPEKLSNALTGGRGIMYATTTENGKKVKYDIGAAIKEYEAVADSGMRYPLTEDLMFFYQVYAKNNGVFQYHLGSGYNEETAWMYACLTMQTSSFTQPSEPEEPVVQLDAPVAKAENVTSSGKIKITWNAVDGAEKYEVYRATSATGTYTRMVTTTGTKYTNTGAAAGVTYYYKVKAIAADGTTADSNVVSKLCKLAQPTVTLSNVASTGKIKVSWSAVSGADCYEIYRATSEKGTYDLKYTTTGTSYTNTGATAGVTYYYKVKAIYADNTKANSEFSDVEARTCDLAQTTVTLSNKASNGKIVVKWEPVKGATKYQVYRATSENGTYTRLITTTSTSITNTSTTAGKTYYYKVRALCDVDSATAAFSEVEGRTCDLPQPSLSIGRSSGKPKLSWAKVTGAVSYRVYRATSKNGTYSLVKTTTSLSWKDTTAKKGKTYYYKVVAVCSNSSGNSAASAIKSIKATK